MAGIKATDPAYIAKCEAERRVNSGEAAREAAQAKLDAERSAARLDASYAMREGFEELDLLLGVVMDPAQDVKTRIAAADKLAPFRHAKKSEPLAVISFDMAGFLRQLREEQLRVMMSVNRSSDLGRDPVVRCERRIALQTIAKQSWKNGPGRTGWRKFFKPVFLPALNF